MVNYTLTIDLLVAGTLRFLLADEMGQIDVVDVPYEGHVDNLLLTTVDNLIKKNSIDRSVLVTVHAGEGIDKNSSLYRIVLSFAAALAVATRR